MAAVWLWVLYLLSAWITSVHLDTNEVEADSNKFLYLGGSKVVEDKGVHKLGGSSKTGIAPHNETTLDEDMVAEVLNELILELTTEAIMQLVTKVLNEVLLEVGGQGLDDEAMEMVNQRLTKTELEKVVVQLINDTLLDKMVSRDINENLLNEIMAQVLNKTMDQTLHDSVQEEVVVQVLGDKTLDEVVQIINETPLEAYAPKPAAFKSSRSPIKPST